MKNNILLVEEYIRLSNKHFNEYFTPKESRLYIEKDWIPESSDEESFIYLDYDSNLDVIYVYDHNNVLYTFDWHYINWTKTFKEKNINKVNIQQKEVAFNNLIDIAVKAMKSNLLYFRFLSDDQISFNTFDITKTRNAIKTVYKLEGVVDESIVMFSYDTTTLLKDSCTLEEIYETIIDINGLFVYQKYTTK